MWFAIDDFGGTGGEMNEKHEAFGADLLELLKHYDATITAASYPKPGPGIMHVTFWLQTEDWAGNPVRIEESEMKLGAKVGETWEAKGKK